MIFRINLKLRFIVLLKSLFYKLNKKDTSKLNHFFLKRTNKKYCNFTSYGRVGLIFLLDYFKKKYPKKKHLIIPSYYLPEMVNIVYAKISMYLFVMCNLIHLRLIYHILKS